jgi:hypothetical protein
MSLFVAGLAAAPLPNMPENALPSNFAVVNVALAEGWHVRRPEASSTLFFRKSVPPLGNYLLNVYYTRGGVMTVLDHPTQGKSELWRSNAYDSVTTLGAILQNPRLHTGLGYRKHADRNYACCVCGEVSSQIPSPANNFL